MKPERLTNEQVYTFCTALYHLTHAGIGLGDSLLLLAEDETDASLRRILQQMAQQADEGSSLAGVIRESGVFPTYVCALTEVGQRVGKTEQTLLALAEHYEQRWRLQRQLRAALMYPAMLMLVLLAVAVILLVYVLPVFNDVYAGLGSELTGFAGGLLAFGGILRQGMPLICAILAAAVILLAVEPVRRKVMDLWNRILGERGAYGKILSARFVQAVSMALTSGMTAQESVQLAMELAQNEAPAFRKRCGECLAAVEQGETLHRALESSGFLSAADSRLLDAGVRSGKGEEVLQHTALRLLEQGEEALQQTVTRLEPILVGIACVLIGAVLLSVMLPLMQIMTAIG